MLYVIADTRIGERGREEFHFNEAYLLENPSENRFIEALENSRVCLDIRMLLKANCCGRIHGRGFRIKEDELYLLFDTRRRLL